VSSTADGAIRVPSLKPGRYRVTVRALGFAPKTLPIVELTVARPDADVGTIGLTPNPLQLESQAVTATPQERAAAASPRRMKILSL
jgi:hypothetical protein